MYQRKFVKHIVCCLLAGILICQTVAALAYWPLPTPYTPRQPEPTEKAKTQYTDFATSFGLLVKDYRPNLTKKNEMFTPLDLSVNADYVFPLVTNNFYYVGEVKVHVENGMVTVHPLFLPTIQETRGYGMFFDNTDSIKTIKQSTIKKNAFPFFEPVDVKRLYNTNDNVILYMKFPLKFNKKIPGVHLISIEDADYKQKVDAFMKLLD